MRQNLVEDYLGIKIDYSRDELIPEQGMVMLTTDGFYKKPWETSPQQGFARAATCYSFGDKEFAQRIYEYSSMGIFTFASPVLTNAVEVNWPEFSEKEFEKAGDWLQENVKPDGMPISCFLNSVFDKKRSLADNAHESKWLSMSGGGIGTGMFIRAPDNKSTGVMAHASVYDAYSLAYKQTESRRGSIAMYLNVNHPEIRQFLAMRDPSKGGDNGKKCFNLNHGVTIPDSFMFAVIKGEEIDLIDPKHGATGIKVNARELFEEIVQTRYDTGEPYMLFIDTCNRLLPDWITHPHYKVLQSNLCVAPETKVLTDKGHLPIKSLEGQTVSVWNGEEFSEVQVVKTGTNQKLLKVETDSGFTLECTPYHKFYVMDGYSKVVEKRAGELKAGDKLIKSKFPVIHGDKQLDYAYANGFYSGDGCSVEDKAKIYLYGDKIKLKPYLDGAVDSWYTQENLNRVCGMTTKLKAKFYVPEADITVADKLSWFAGVCDADGTVALNGKTQALQVGNINYEFLQQIQLMLQTLGVASKVTVARDSGTSYLPKNDGTGEYKDYPTKKLYRLLIGQNGVNTLKDLGFAPKRLILPDHLPNRDATRFVQVTQVTDEGRYDDTYCFTEPKRHMGVFNGLLTGNCTEITLRTSEKRTAVCCLSSLNLVKFYYLSATKQKQVVRDLVRLLDNVLEYFIRLAPPELSRAIYSAKKERAIGLGTLGWHSLLQSLGIPFEQIGGFGGGIQLTHQVYGLIKQAAVEESLRLGKLRGEAPDCAGSGMRNSHLLAVA